MVSGALKRCSEGEDNVTLRRETEALKIKLAEYERAAAVVAMAAQKVEAELKQQQQQDVVVSKVVKGGGITTTTAGHRIQTEEENENAHIAFVFIL